MEAVPQNVELDGRDHLTGLSCPDCHGVLRVKAIGPQSTLQFICRIGHTYMVSELLQAKEEDLETRAWGAVVAAEELAALVQDLVRERQAGAETAGRLSTRYDSAQKLANAFRTAIENDQPLLIETDLTTADKPRRP